MKCLWCETDLPETKGKPLKFCLNQDKCKISYYREQSRNVILIERTTTSVFSKESNAEKEGNKELPEKSNSIRVFSDKQRKNLLDQKKRAVWVDVLEYPDLTYTESVIQCLGDAPNAIFAAAARKVVKSKSWDASRAFAFNENIF